MSNTEKSYVLVADDNTETCTLLKALLQRDFLIEIATDGMEAVERTRTRRYAAVLLDLRMPQHDGFVILDHLKATQPDLLKSVIVVTAASPREIERARSYGPCAIVSKPFDVDKLLALVKRCANPDTPNLGTVFCAPMMIMIADLLQRNLIN